MRHTMTLEIELDVDVPDGVTWKADVKDAIEDHIDALLRARLDGKDIALAGGASLRVDGHSTVAVPGAWPYR